MNLLRSRVVVVAMSAAALAIAAWPTLSSGFPNWSAPYASRPGYDCVSTAWVDPVGVVFEGDEARHQNVARAFEVHLGWYDNSGEGQALYVKYVQGGYLCVLLDHQRANGGGPQGRHHIRLWHIPASTGPDKKVAGTPHHEDWVFPCGHAVDANGPNGSGFDRGRQAVRDAFASVGHAVDHREWGNTRNFKQCDNEWAGSNGGGVNIGMGHTH